MLTEVDEKVGVVKTQWSHIRQRVRAVEPVVAEMIDSLNPDKKFPLFLAYYPYGGLIGDTESPLLPAINGGFYRILDQHAPKEITTHLAYGHANAPLGMILEKNFETFIDLPDEGITIPWEILSPGIFFPLNKILSNPKSQRVYPSNKVLTAVSGARSTFMLPNIGSATQHNNLKRDYRIETATTKLPYEHWQLFKEIVNSPIINCDWRSCLIYFSENWINKIHGDKTWLPLKAYLHQKAWERSEYLRSHMYYEAGFSVIQKKRNLKPDPYLADTARHLIAIALGEAPGYVPACSDDFLPVSVLQKVFIQSYGMKKYYPTIIQPTRFVFEKDILPVYYSSQVPSTHVFSPRARKISSTLSEMRELEYIMKCFLEELKCKNGVCSDTVLHQIAQQVEFKYFHNEHDKHQVIQSSKNLIESDPRFTFLSIKLAGCDQFEFSSDAKFLRGCVRIGSLGPGV